MTLDLSNPAMRHIAQFIGSVMAILTFIWFIAEPRAQSYIKDQIVAENVQLKKSIQNANRNLEKTKQELRDLRRQADKADAQRETILEQGKETRQLIYQLLQRPN